MGTQATQLKAGKTISATKEVFDLESKGPVTLKKIGELVPVATAQEFMARLGNDTALMLQIMNDGLEQYEANRLATDENIPWKLSVVDPETKVETLSDFTGIPLSEEKSEQVDATVMNFARMFFGYQKTMVAGEDKDSILKNRDAKKEAKQKALDMFMSNTAAIEMLKAGK